MEQFSWLSRSLWAKYSLTEKSAKNKMIAEQLLKIIKRQVYLFFWHYLWNTKSISKVNILICYTYCMQNERKRDKNCSSQWNSEQERVKFYDNIVYFMNYKYNHTTIWDIWFVLYVEGAIINKYAGESRNTNTMIKLQFICKFSLWN